MEFYIGKGVGNRVIEALRDAKKSVIVISPWIGKGEAEIINSLKVEKAVLTGEEGNKSLEVLPQRSFDLRWLSIGLLLFFGGLLSFVVNLDLLAIALTGIGIIFILYSQRETLPSWVKIENRLHAKIYIIDDDVYLTSANLTPSGAKRNIEFLLILRGREGEEVKRKVKAYLKSYGI